MVRVSVQSGLKSVLLAFLVFAIVSGVSFVGAVMNTGSNPANAAPLTLSFETVSNTRAALGALASRSQCKVMTKQGTGPYLMTGTDSRSGSAYSFETDVNYAGAQLNESRESPNNVSYTHLTGQTHSGRSGVLRLQVSGSVAGTGTCDGRQVNTSAFGPEVYTLPFQARAGQALSFNWSAATISGGDDYEIYAFLVGVDGTANDRGTAASSTLLAHGRGKSQGWKTSTGTIPSDGYYRFRFVNGSYDASGGTVLGAAMFIDTNVLVGEANNITFNPLSDRVTSSNSQTFTIAATTSSTGLVTFSSSFPSRCTVGVSTLSNGESTATVTVLAGQTGLCTISADSASLGEYATASTVTRSFTILAAPTAPTNSGGTAVSGTTAVGQTLTAVEGSWGDGGSAITGTTFQWESCTASSCSWTTVASATDSTLVVGSSDVGKKFRVKVAKTNNIGTTTVNSSESGTVAKGSQSGLTISTTTATYGQNLELSTTGGSGTGVVTFAKVSGTCSISGTQLVPGDTGSECVITATKAGDAAYNPLTTASTTISIVRAPQSNVVVTSVLGTFGSNLSLTTTGGSGTGSVSWQVVSGACTVSGALLTPTAAGDSCTVRATKAADTNYLSKSSSDTTVTFAKAAQSELLEVTTNSLTYGESTTLTASGGSGAGTVSFSRVTGPCTVNAAIVTTSDIGTCVVTATRQSDDDYLAATSVQKSISIGTRQITFSIAALTKKYDGLTDADLRVGALNGVINDDSVSVNISRISGRFANADVGDNKLVTLTILSNLLQGADASKYSYATPANPRTAIEKATQTDLRFTSGSKMTVGDSLRLETSGGQTNATVTFSTNSADCRVTNGQLTATKGGITCDVVATKAGDASYESTSVTQTLTVDKIIQQLTFRSSEPASPTVGSTYTVSVSSSASLAPTVVIASASSGVCTIAAEVVTFNAPGTCLVSASQSGNDTYSAAAASQSLAVVVAPVAPTQSTETSGSVVLPRNQIAQTAIAASPSTTVAVPTSTTTITTLPNRFDPSRPMTGESGVLPRLDTGVMTASVQGKTVQATTVTNVDNISIELPNNVRFVMGATDADGRPLLVGTDGAISLSASNQIRVKMSGLVPGTTYTAFLFSEPVEIGRGVAGPDGTVNALFAVPRELEAGGHTLQVNGVGPDSAVVSVSMGITLQETYNSTPMLLLFIALAMAAALFIPLQMRRKVRLKALLMRR